MRSTSWWARIIGSPVSRDLSGYRRQVESIAAAEQRFAHFDDAAIGAASAALIERAAAGGDLDELLIEAFALVRAAAARTIELRPFDEQVIAGIGMHEGNLVQMNTGEGKTLAAVFTAYLRGAAGDGVHVLTVNDYLARRDAGWMGPIYDLLGLSVGWIEEGLTPEARRAAYARDVTYLTAKEAGFDLLRDALRLRREELVQRPFHFAIVDEADSILIDEARIPLVIAEAADDLRAQAHRLAEIVGALDPGAHYRVDEYRRNVELTDLGLSVAESRLGGVDLLAEHGLTELSALNCALHAEVLLRRDVDYIVDAGAIKLVDELTGRVADDRHWPDGLQAAVEAKEGLELRPGGRILGSIPIQHLIRRYPGACGMTATAESSAVETADVYDLKVLVLPPHRPCVRVDHRDRVFTHMAAKRRALIAEIDRVHRTGRPILVGTASVAESEKLAADLAEHEVECRVLNARDNAQEAEIIAEAGALGAVTISTNMAGRGTDIRLGGAEEADRDRVVELGGLYLIGTNRHESRRIDDQLRGRAGRQGDPGSSRFFVSLDDDLIARYGVRRLIPAPRLPAPQDDPLDDRLVEREIDRAQRIVEGQNGDIRKSLARYSSHIEFQRRIISRHRRDVLSSDTGARMLRSFDERLYERLCAHLGGPPAHQLARRMVLLEIDRAWSDHLAAVADIREGIHLARLGRQNPLHEFQRETTLRFARMHDLIERGISRRFAALDPASIDLDSAELRGPSATWTYLVNDDPFAEALGRALGNIGFGFGAALLWPLTLAWAWVIRRQRR